MKTAMVVPQALGVVVLVILPPMLYAQVPTRKEVCEEQFESQNRSCRDMCRHSTDPACPDPCLKQSAIVKRNCESPGGEFTLSRQLPPSPHPAGVPRPSDAGAPAREHAAPPAPPRGTAAQPCDSAIAAALDAPLETLARLETKLRDEGVMMLKDYGRYQQEIPEHLKRENEVKRLDTFLLGARKRAAICFDLPSVEAAIATYNSWLQMRGPQFRQVTLEPILFPRALGKATSPRVHATNADSGQERQRAEDIPVYNRQGERILWANEIPWADRDRYEAVVDRTGKLARREKSAERLALERQIEEFEMQYTMTDLDWSQAKARLERVQQNWLMATAGLEGTEEAVVGRRIEQDIDEQKEKIAQLTAKKFERLEAELEHGRDGSHATPYSQETLDELDRLNDEIETEQKTMVNLQAKLAGSHQDQGELMVETRQLEEEVNQLAQIRQRLDAERREAWEKLLQPNTSAPTESAYAIPLEASSVGASAPVSPKPAASSSSDTTSRPSSTTVSNASGRQEPRREGKNLWTVPR